MMKPDWILPREPFKKFAEVYQALEIDRSWYEGSACLKFAAMVGICSPYSPSELSGKIRSMAQEIKELSGWFGALNSPLRFIVSALLVLHGDTARGFIDEVDRVKGMFKKISLSKSNIYTTLAILILRLRQEGARIPESQVRRLKQIYDEMKRTHWWLTGADDYPACAILVHEADTPTVIGNRIEEIYQALRHRGFHRGNPLQGAANILYLTHQKPTTIARHFKQIADELRSNRVRIFQTAYDELALLTFLRQRPSDIARRMVALRDKVRRIKPKPTADLAFNLAASVCFYEMIQRDRDMKIIQDAKALMDMQAILAAQQAAAAAAAGAAAASAATSGGG